MIGHGSGARLPYEAPTAVEPWLCSCCGEEIDPRWDPPHPDDPDRHADCKEEE